MKKLIFSSIISIIIGGTAAAQTAHNNAAKHHSTSPAKKKAKNPVVKKDTLDQRKNYEWKNGQEATPTGNEARGINDNGFSVEKKDSSRKRKPVSKKQG